MAKLNGNIMKLNFSFLKQVCIESKKAKYFANLKTKKKNFIPKLFTKLNFPE